MRKENVEVPPLAFQRANVQLPISVRFRTSLNVNLLRTCLGMNLYHRDINRHWFTLVHYLAVKVIMGIKIFNVRVFDLDFIMRLYVRHNIELTFLLKLYVQRLKVTVYKTYNHHYFFSLITKKS